MANKLCIMVCEYYEREATAIVESEKFDDVMVKTFSADCNHPQAESGKLVEIINACKGRCNQVHLFCSFCITRPENLSRELEYCHFHKMDSCFSMFINKSIVDGYLKEGAHLFTPGWLKNWRHSMEKNRFNQQTAQMFFGDSTAKLVLLDTGVDLKSADNLREIAGFIRLPFEIVPTGLDFFSLLLTRVVSEWRLKNERNETTLALSGAKRHLADYAMMYDLFSDLTRTKTETEAIYKILNVFAALFAPDSIVYIPLTNGKPGSIQSRPISLADNEAAKNRMLGLHGDYIWTESKNGFILRISYQNETLGILEVAGFAFPEHKEYYLNRSLILASVCGMAISNTRTYQLLFDDIAKRKRVEEELKMLNESLEQQIEKRTIMLIKANEELQMKIAERKQADEALRESEERLRSILDNSVAVIYIKDVHGRYTFINKQLETLFHLKREEVKGKTDLDLWPKELANTYRANDQRVIETKTAMEFEEVAVQEDGHHTYVSVKVPLFDSTGAVYAMSGISTDITERKRAEAEKAKLREQLYHAQKIDSIGTLAGGIAHDFNNILMVIIGYVNLLQTEIKENVTAMDFVQKIMKSAEKAANLTRGLLTFSRKQPTNPQLVNLNDVIKDVESMLARVIREDIKLKTVRTNKNCIIMADKGQIEQVLTNLATNARDAMSNGGFLTIITDIVEMDDSFIKAHGYGVKGMYDLISVSDTGMGIDEKIREKIFEPFFTTKEVGKGTGLGLAIVYGIVKQHNGYINVYSEPGKGTTFRIYLPLIRQEIEKTQAEIHAIPKGGTETILVAEDNAEIRHIAKLVLEGHGYKVIEAVDGGDAINKFEENKDKFQLLILDVIMPVKNGKEVYDAIKKMKPDMKTIFMSGYSKDIIQDKDIFKEGLNFISKPVSPMELLRKVREALDK